MTAVAPDPWAGRQLRTLDPHWHPPELARQRSRARLQCCPRATTYRPTTLRGAYTGSPHSRGTMILAVDSRPLTRLWQGERKWCPVVSLGKRLDQSGKRCPAIRQLLPPLLQE